jgi:acetyltransferase-like isoleucine patch superfamily enzyme
MLLTMKLIKIFQIIKNEFLSIIEFLIVEYPSTEIGNKVRSYYWSKKYQITSARYIGKGVYINSPDLIQIGSGVILGDNTIIENSNSYGCYIGNFVGIARNSFIRTADHQVDDLDVSFMDQGHVAKKIKFKKKEYSVVIEDNVWIAANVTILTGSHIGQGSIVSAGSVVSKEIPAYSIVVGNPARVVANRKKIEKIRK